MSDTGPREEDGDYAREFFDAYERQADEAERVFCHWFGGDIPPLPVKCPARDGYCNEVPR